MAFDLLDPRKAIQLYNDTPRRLDSWGEEWVYMKGIAADGAARVVVRIPAYDLKDAVPVIKPSAEGTVADYGSLESIDGAQSGTSLTLQPTTTSAGKFFFFYYRAPENFLRTGSETTDKDLLERFAKIDVRLSIGGDSACHLVDSIKIVRPPVLLLHGVWSSIGAAFSPAYRATLAEGDKRVVGFRDYRTTNHREFYRNIYAPREGIASVINKLSSQGIVAMQADVVAHSMGALLTRLHIQDDPLYRRVDNFNEGDVNRIISINSPYWGSPLSDILLRMANPCAQFGYPCGVELADCPNPPCESQLQAGCKLLKHLECQITKRADGFLGGAVADLSSTSSRISSWTSCDIPAHALVGDVTQGAGLADCDLKSERALWWTSDLSHIYRMITGQPFVESATKLFCDDGHDYIVGLSSQRGGLGGNEVSTLGQVCHTSATKDTYAQNVLEILNTRGDNPAWGNLPAFSSAYLCSPPPFSTAVADMDKTGSNKQSEATRASQSVSIQIVTPTPGTVFHPGDAAQIQLTVSGATPPTEVIVIGDGLAETMTGAPYTLTWTIPDDATSSCGFFVMAFNGDEYLGAAGPASFGVDIGGDPVSMEAWPEYIRLKGPGSSMRLDVIGNYSNQVSRDLLSFPSGVICAVVDPTVASIDPSGTIHALDSGETDLSISLGALSVTAHILVESNEVQPPTDCYCSCAADPKCDGVANVLDVVNCIGVAFRGSSAIPDPDAACPVNATDVDCTGATDVIDVVKVVDVAFRAADPANKYCDPCL